MLSLVLNLFFYHEVYSFTFNPNETQAQPGDFPAQVSIIYRGEHKCGGVFISDSYVVTAAHCIFPFGRNITVLSGITNTDHFPISNVHKISEIIIHPEFRYYTRDFDVALIKIEKPITEKTRNANYIDVIKADCEIIGGEFVTMIYWKKDEDEKSLMYRDTALWQPSLCQPQTILVISLNPDEKPLTKELICAGWMEPCYEDDTTAILRNGSLLGVGNLNLNCFEKEKPLLFTNLAIFRDWIDSYRSG